ncbi:hypothetical protein RDV79_23225 (plasmid) [Aeromonas dhakensis]|mgnify:CR=1 FL=1|uniref:hypothetical protein n=1 Tax=Aeromonas TaxID=642 RepID=UPI002246CE10|nr:MULTISPECIES: hypothetical protein [Aeromonas]MCX0424824.1 hypothetical protein [Aeromonas veronii]WPS59301.1 hypothetical protein RDV79_23225 [Aeromonas dhakensis]
MLKITYEVNGRKITPGGLKNAIEAAVLSGIEQNIKKSIGSIRCREHGQHPTILVKGRSLDNLSIHVNGCCDELIEEVKKKL